MMYHPSPFRSSPASILESLLLFQLLLFHRERSLFLQKDLGTFFQSFAGTKSEGIEVSSCMSHALKISFTRRDARTRENKNACPGPGALNRWLRFTKERTLDLPRQKGAISRLSLGCIDGSGEGEGAISTTNDAFRSLVLI